MRVLPIPFTAPMVRAILREIEQPGTGKTQTRRLLPVQPAHVPHYGWSRDSGATFTAKMPDGTEAVHRLKYWAGDRLYVREHWRTLAAADAIAPRDLPRSSRVAFEADPTKDNRYVFGKFRQGMHMPRWASRLTLEVTDLRIERLQEISEEDAIKEGIEWITRTSAGDFYRNFHNPDCPLMAYGAYRSLWNHINGAGAWDANPWVVAVSFRPHLKNIDSYLERNAA